jgi:hypothetical protein
VSQSLCDLSALWLRHEDIAVRVVTTDIVRIET